MKKIVLFFSFLIISNAYAGDCVRTGSVCVDKTPCKNISGVEVCLSQIGQTCWEYEDTYTCLKPNAVDYCQPLISAGCWQTSSQCVQTDTYFNTGCMRYTQTYRCGDPSLPTPPNTIRLDNTYTLVSSDYDTSQCQSFDQNQNCKLAESVCVQTSPSEPLPPGINPSQVAPDGCYKKEQRYACLTGRVDGSGCSDLESDPACIFQSSVCSGEKINNTCLSEERTYKCMVSPGSTTVVDNCGSRALCFNGTCFDTSYENDQDFARVMATMEAAREAGVYMKDFKLFNGSVDKCREKAFANCCKSKKGGPNNNQLAMTTAMEIGKAIGSPYMYDALFTYGTDWMVDKAVAAWGANGLPGWSGSMNFYGFSFAFSPTAGFTYVGFDPYSFALQVGLMILNELMSCEQQEVMTAMKVRQGLCRKVGTYCSAKILGFCYERTRSYCCFNSRLAKIINEQGRAQIGKGWGTPKNPDCSGFTQDEFERIDFSRIDMTPFLNEIMSNTKLPNIEQLGEDIKAKVDQKVQNYFRQ